MRPIRAIIAVVLSGTIFCGNCYAQPAEPNDLSAYYGFGPIEIIKLDPRIRNLRIADFNGDGRNDIAVVNNRKARIELLIQKEDTGPADSQVTVDAEDVDINAITALTRFKNEAVAVSQKVLSLVSGDLNSDGLSDLAFYGEPMGLYVILQRADEEEAFGRRGKLSWQSRKKINLADALQTSESLLCADLNNDGLDDLALAGRNEVYLILQRQDGTLSEPVTYPATARILQIRAGDLNGDGINDLIAVTNDRERRIHVRFGQAGGQLGPQVQLFMEKPYRLVLCNIDGLAGEEILTVDSVSGRLGCYKLTSQDGGDADWPILFYPLATGPAGNRRDLVVADIDGDGLDDITISDPDAAELVLYKQAAGLGLAEPVRFPAFAEIESLSAADIDGDGKSELGVLSVKEKVIGISRFEDDRLTFPKPIETTGQPVAMDLADLDGDGGTDCLYISRDANDARFLRVVYNLGAGGKTKKGLLEKIPLPGGSSYDKKSAGDKLVLFLEKLTFNPDGLKVLDVDQDGLSDVLIFVSYEQPILVRQTKTGAFELIDSAAAQLSLIKDAASRSIAVCDMDGRGGEELLVAQKNFARSLVFADGRSWSVIDQYNAKSTENNILAVAAFNLDRQGPGDRPAILLLDGQKGQLQILKAGADKTYRFDKQLDVGKWDSARHLKVLFAALTGGETRSIVLFDSAKFALITPPGGLNVPERLQQQFSYQTRIKDGIYGHLAAGDINSDGRADIVMVEYKRNHIEILASDAEHRPVPAMRFKIFEEKSRRGSDRKTKSLVEPRELAIADVTADGKADLVTIIHDRVIIYPQD